MAGVRLTFPADEYRIVALDFLDIFDRFESAEFRPGYVRTGFLAHGWMLRVVRGVRAILLLEEEGFVGEAAPLRRSVLEHAVALAWLATEGDSILDTISNGHKYGGERMRAAAEEAKWSTEKLNAIDEALATTQVTNRSNDNLLHFAHRATKFGTVDDVLQYLSETQLSHACYESAIAYIDVDRSHSSWKPHEWLSRVASV